MRATLSRRDQQRLNCIRDSRTGHKFSSSRRAILLNTRVPPLRRATQSSRVLSCQRSLLFVDRKIYEIYRRRYSDSSGCAKCVLHLVIESNDYLVSRLRRFVDFKGILGFCKFLENFEIWILGIQRTWQSWPIWGI